MKGFIDAENIHNIIRSDSKGIFLGGTRKSASDPWKWNDGSPVNQFNHFVTGESSNRGQRCLVMKHDDDSKFRDAYCNAHRNAILCQRKNAGIEE